MGAFRVELSGSVGAAIRRRALAALALAALALTAFALFGGNERGGVGAAPAEAQAAASSGGDADSLRVYSIVLDGLRPQEVTPDLMPNLSELRAGGTWYEQARAVFIAETLPNHAAMMTGVRPARNGIVSNDFSPSGAGKSRMSNPGLLDADTLNTRIERACPGVETANVLSKDYLWRLFDKELPRDDPLSPPYLPDDDPDPQLRADFHWDPQKSPFYIKSPDDHAPDFAVWREGFLPWFRDTTATPQFAFVNLGDIDRAGHIDEFAAGAAGAPGAPSGLTASRQAALRDSDNLLGLFIAELRDSDLWDQTVLIITSDHGMAWNTQDHAWGQGGAVAETTDEALTAAGYVDTGGTGAAGKSNPASKGDFGVVNSGGAQIIYAEEKDQVDEMAQIIARVEGVSFVATRHPVPALDNPTYAELGLDDKLRNADGTEQGSPGARVPYYRAGDIIAFAKPGWAAEPGIPGNHGHPMTQHSVLLVAGGHPVVDETPESVAGETVYDSEDKPEGSPPMGGPGNLSVAPTVAALFGLGEPVGQGYDRGPLREAFHAWALEPHAPCRANTPAAASSIDGGSTPPPAADDGGGGSPGNAGPGAPDDQTGGPCANQVLGTARKDELGGTAGSDLLSGLAGDDRLAALGGDDCVNGGGGEDRLRGGAGDDKLRGGIGEDRMRGGGGDDVIRARRGGGDRIDCGAGDDVVFASLATDRLRGCEKVRAPEG